MAIESAPGVLTQTQTAFKQSSLAPQAKPESAATEASETKEVTQREAAKGDPVAQRKLDKEAASEETAKSGESAAKAEGKGVTVSTVA